jgi:hypothetical protein
VINENYYKWDGLAYKEQEANLGKKSFTRLDPADVDIEDVCFAIFQLKKISCLDGATTFTTTTPGITTLSIMTLKHNNIQHNDTA